MQASFNLLPARAVHLFLRRWAVAALGRGGAAAVRYLLDTLALTLAHSSFRGQAANVAGRGAALHDCGRTDGTLGCSARASQRGRARRAYLA